MKKETEVKVKVAGIKLLGVGAIIGAGQLVGMAVRKGMDYSYAKTDGSDESKEFVALMAGMVVLGAAIAIVKIESILENRAIVRLVNKEIDKLKALADILEAAKQESENTKEEI
jgi:hypothetical protein